MSKAELAYDMYIPLSLKEMYVYIYKYLYIPFQFWFHQ